MRRSRLLVSLVLLLLVSACSFADKEVLGKLGQATSRTPIYAQMSSHSRVYYHVKPYEYLVLQSTESSYWLRVLMQNGMYGYIRAETVAKLPYQVTAEVEKPRGGAMLSSRGTSVASRSMQYIGTPYVWGGNDPTSGIDCSGFVKELYGEIGIRLPRTAAEQALVGQPIARLQDLQAGDRLYFWDGKRGKIGHTGIYLGKGYFIHSSHGRGGVATDYLGSKSWLRLLVAARR